jgi:hypothetical protein
MLNQKNAPGLDLVTARMLKELPKEGLVNLMYVYIQRHTATLILA